MERVLYRKESMHVLLMGKKGSPHCKADHDDPDDVEPNLIIDDAQ